MDRVFAVAAKGQTPCDAALSDLRPKTITPLGRLLWPFGLKPAFRC